MTMNFRKLQKPTMAAMLLFTASVLIGSSAAAQSFRLSAVSDMVRVFEDGYKLPQMYDSIKLFGIRGETISGQFVISAGKNLTDVTVEIGELKDNMTGNSLPAAAVTWNFVGSIPLTKNTPNQPVSALVRQAPARFPEYLMTERQLDVKEKTWQSVWLTVSIPEKAATGVYVGKITVMSGQEIQSLPVSIEVFPLTMPSERHLNVVEWYSTGGFAKLYGIKERYSPEWYAMLRKYAENMVEHRQNSFRVGMDVIEIQQLKEGTFSFDFSRFDKIADVFWSTG